MIDLYSTINNPNYDVQYFVGLNPSGITWKKPRGAKMVYMLGVGAGAGGQCGVNTAGTSGGGAGGPSGCQQSLFIPAFFLPDILYVFTGPGGIGATTAGGGGGSGGGAYVSLEDETTCSLLVFILANPGGAGSQTDATSTAGGIPLVAGSAPSPSTSSLIGKGFYTNLAGIPGTNGGAYNAPGAGIIVPQTGIIVTGGCSGGGCNGTTAYNGGGFSFAQNPLGNEFFSLPNAGIAATGSTPATKGDDGNISRYMMMNFGGAGGGGATTTAGGIAGAGGDGAPGCGGGGGGGMNTTNPTIARGGNGGPSFVYIITSFK